jgi:hypothetical protein
VVYVCLGPSQTDPNNKFSVLNADGTITNSAYSSNTYILAQPLYTQQLPSQGWNLQQYKPIALNRIYLPDQQKNELIHRSATINGVAVGLVYNHDAEGWRQYDRVLAGQGLIGGALSQDMQAFKPLFNPKSFKFIGTSSGGNDYLYEMVF